MMTRKKIINTILVLFVVGVFSAFGTYMYVFHKPHRNIAKEKPAFIVTAQDFIAEFETDEDAAYAKYGNKVIQVEGVIVEIAYSDTTATVVLENEFNGVAFSFDSKDIAKYKEQFSNLSEQKTINIKGKCDGYDMIMGIVLTQSVFIN